MQSNLNKIATKHMNVLLIGLAVAFLSLIPRLEGDYFIGKYLWAEDGNIFINQAQLLGASAIWTPYAGYLHVYPRLVSYISGFFELAAQTYFFLGGWAIAFGLLASVMINRAASLGLKVISVCGLVALVALQPVRGEVFFNITNTQWILAPALTIYLLTFTDTDENRSKFAYLLLAIGSLSGPFSILVAPLLLLRGLFLKNFKDNYWLYAIVFGCALVQLILMITTNRVETSVVDLDFKALLYTTWRLITFHANDPYKFLAAFLFWTAFAISMILLYKKNSETEKTRMGVALLLFGAGAVNILAALYAFKGNSWALYAWGGSRYTWVPYTLFFFAAVAASVDFKKLQAILFLSMAVTSLLNIEKVSLSNLQFNSYLNFSKYKRISIPINPRYAIYPEWHVDSLGFESNKDQPIRGYQMPPDVVAKKNGTLFYQQLVYCPGATDIGVEVDLTRSEQGWVILFWSSSQNFNVTNSLRRFYPRGKIKAQFAFPNSPAGLYLRFDSLLTKGEVQIEQTIIYCLP